MLRKIQIFFPEFWFENRNVLFPTDFIGKFITWRENSTLIAVLEFNDSRYVDAKQYHLASFSTRNSTPNTSLC